MPTIFQNRDRGVLQSGHRCRQLRHYKALSTATEMMKNTWKRVLKNNQSYLSDPEKQKVLRFAMQRPALYLNELEACMEQILAETLEEAEKTA